MNIEHVHIESYKGIDSIDVEARGRNVFVIGGNAQGKTSVISAIWAALTNKGIPPEPIQAGKRKAVIQVELNGLVAELKFEKKPKGKIARTFSLTDTETGEVVESPRAAMQRIIGTLDFDPFAFMTMTPKAQLDYFCKVFGVDVKRLEQDYDELNEAITYNKKQIIAITESIEPYDPKLLSVNVTSQSELLEEYQQAVKAETERAAFIDRLTSTKAKAEALKAKILSMGEELVDLQDKVAKGEAWLAANEAPDSGKIKETLDSFESEAAAIALAHKSKAAEDSIVKLEEENEENANAKKAKLAAKKHLISEHLKNVDGLTFDDRGFLLDGLPFHIDQSNTAAQIVAGIKLGSSLLGDVKIIRFDGSLLDSDSMKEVGDFAEAQGLQLFVELVDRQNGGLRIEYTEEQPQ